MEMGGKRHAPTALHPRKDLVPIVWENVWAPGLVWRGAENLASTGIRYPDCPARSNYTNFAIPEHYMVLILY